MRQMGTGSQSVIMRGHCNYADAVLNGLETATRTNALLMRKVRVIMLILY